MRTVLLILPAAMLLATLVFPTVATATGRWERSYNMGTFAVGVETAGGDLLTFYCSDTHGEAVGELKVSLEAVLAEPLTVSAKTAVDGSVEIGARSWPVPFRASADATSVTWNAGDPGALARLGEIVNAMTGHGALRLILPDRSLDFPLARAPEALAGMPCLR